MPGQSINSSNKPYLRIVGGNLVQTVDKDTEGAKLREYETADGKKGSKWELRYMNWSGKIKSISFKDTEYGEMCNIDLGDAQLSLNTASRYFTDFASKIPNVNLEKPVILHPYDMELEGKRRSGISMQQDTDKIKSYYYDGEKNINGFPEVNEEQQKKLKKNYWKIYFAEVTAFLVEQLEKLEIPTSTEDNVKEIFDVKDELPSDLPF